MVRSQTSQESIDHQSENEVDEPLPRGETEMSCDIKCSSEFEDLLDSSNKSSIYTFSNRSSKLVSMSNKKHSLPYVFNHQKSKTFSEKKTHTRTLMKKVDDERRPPESLDSNQMGSGGSIEEEEKDVIRNLNSLVFNNEVIDPLEEENKQEESHHTSVLSQISKELPPSKPKSEPAILKSVSGDQRRHYTIPQIASLPMIIEGNYISRNSKSTKSTNLQLKSSNRLQSYDNLRRNIIFPRANHILPKNMKKSSSATLRMRTNSLSGINISNSNISLPESSNNEEEVIHHHHCTNYEAMPINGDLIIEVEDTGMGMSAEEMKELFRPFQQANKQVYGEHGGTGIGLWLSYEIVKAMKGTLDCNSHPGGTTFTLKLPVQCSIIPKSAKRVRRKSQFGVRDSLSPVHSGVIVNPSPKPHVLKGMKIATILNISNPLPELLSEYGCEVIVCISVEDYLAYMRSKIDGNVGVPVQAVLVEEDYAGFIHALIYRNKYKNIGIKLRQLIVISNQPLSQFMNIDEYQIFQFVIQKPVKIAFLLHLLLHIKRGEELMKNAGLRLFTPVVNNENKRNENKQFGIAPTTFTYNNSGDHMGILIVDDNSFVKKTMVRMCGLFASNIIEASSGIEVSFIYI